MIDCMINVEDEEREEVINKIKSDESESREIWENEEDKNEDNITEEHILIAIKTFWSFECIARRVKALWVWAIRTNQRLSYFSICFHRSSMILFCLVIQHSRSLIQVSCVVICFHISLQLIVTSSTFFFISLMSSLFILISRTRRCSFFSIYSSNSRNIWLWVELRKRLQEIIIIFLITDSESDAIKNKEKLAWDQEERRLERSDEETELTRLNSKSDVILTWKEFEWDKKVLESSEEKTELTEMSVELLSSALKSIN